MAKATYDVAMSNGLALAFIAEAFLLIFFITMSIIGSMVFSVPLQLYFWSKPKAN